MKECRCGRPATTKVGKQWYCNTCLSNGDDEDHYHPDNKEKRRHGWNDWNDDTPTGSFK